MTKDEFLEGIGILALAHQGKEIKEEWAENLYSTYFMDYRKEVWLEACRKLGLEDTRFFPTAGRMKSAYDSVAIDMPDMSPVAKAGCPHCLRIGTRQYYRKREYINRLIRYDYLAICNCPHGAKYRGNTVGWATWREMENVGKFVVHKGETIPEFSLFSDRREE